MNVTDIPWLLEHRAPATADAILAVEAELSVTIPDSYRRFLLATNGAVGNFASLYGTDELVEMNRTYEVQEYAPGYLSIGNDGGGYHLLIRAEPDAVEFRLVSDGVGVPSDRDCTDNLAGWLTSADGNPWRNRAGS